MMAQFCHKCGTPSKNDESVFCNKCGTKYIQSPPEKKDDVCPNCETEIIDKQSVFCARCGSPFSHIQPPTNQHQPITIKSKKICPHCNGPIIDESRYYCDTCGAYLQGSQPQKNEHNKKINENNKLGQVKVFGNQKITYEQFKAYKPNWILFLAFAFGLISIVVPALLVLIVIASAIAVYYDAKAIRAGEKITDESTMNTHSWSPLSWGLIVLLLWIIGLPLYLFKRREIFFLNYREMPVSISDEHESDVRIQSYPQRTPNIEYQKNPQSVTVEFILGLLGGIIGFFAGFAAIFVGGLGGAFGMQGASQIIGLGFGAIFFSIIGIIGAAIVKSKTKTSGYLMIISAIGGLICISAFYILSFILLIVAGVMAVRHKE
jgi:hypothetical protein